MTYTPLPSGSTPALGTSGNAVSALQTQLNTQNTGVAGYTPLTVDGKYGPLTQAASQIKAPVISNTGAYSSAVNLGNQTNTGIATNSSSTGSVVSTSNPIVAGEKSTTSDLNSLISNNTADVTTAHQAYLDMLDKQSQQLDLRLQNQLNGINSTFDNSTKRLGETQKSETGTFGATLQRIGGYLGDSASATGAMISLNQQHTYQINDLDAKRAAAIQEATQAIQDKQFDVAKSKTQEAKDYAKSLTDSKQQYLENVMKLNEFQKGAIKDKLANLAYLTPDKISPQTKAEIDGFYGTPGFTDNYIAVTNAAKDVKNQKDVMDARKATLDFLQNIPSGQKIKMPDGTEFTGMGKAGDVATFMQTDSSGVGHLITYNKLTGAKSITSLGVVGKNSGAGTKTVAKTDPVVKDNAVNVFQTSLESTKKGDTYDPDTYLKLRNQLKDSDNPQLLPYMDNLFLNKSNGFFNDDAISKLRKKGIYYGSTIISADPATADNNGDTTQSDNSQ